MICTNCGTYFKHTSSNKTSICDQCLDNQDPFMYDKESEVEFDVQSVIHPSYGRTLPVFIDELQESC